MWLRDHDIVLLVSHVFCSCFIFLLLLLAVALVMTYPFQRWCANCGVLGPPIWGGSAFDYYRPKDFYFLFIVIVVVCCSLHLIFFLAFSSFCCFTFSSFTSLAFITAVDGFHGSTPSASFSSCDGSPYPTTDYILRFGHYLEACWLGAMRIVRDQPSMYDRRFDKSCATIVKTCTKQWCHYCGRGAG